MAETMPRGRRVDRPEQTREGKKRSLRESLKVYKSRIVAPGLHSHYRSQGLKSLEANLLLEHHLVEAVNLAGRS
jgi:hypothetical protein